MMLSETQYWNTRSALTLAVLWLAGIYLRSPVLIMPPLEPAISNELGLGQAAAGALTTVPMLMLSIGAIVGSAVVGRLGSRSGVALGLVLIALASPARGLAPPVAFLFGATVLTGLGIAIMQPALSSLAHVLTPTRLALAVSVFMNGMYTGEFLSAGLTRFTLLPLTSGDWRLALLLASVPALPIAAAIILIRAPADAVTHQSVLPRVALVPDWRNRKMWGLGFLLSGSSVLFIGTNAYMPDIVHSSGTGAGFAYALFWFNLSQVVVSLVMLCIAQRLVLKRWPLVTNLFASLVGALILVLVGGSVGLGAAFILGMATAAQLMLVVMAAPYLAPAGETARMSAGIFTIGYGLSFVIPLISGGFAQWIGIPWAAMLPMIGWAAAMTPLALTMRLPRTD